MGAVYRPPDGDLRPPVPPMATTPVDAWPSGGGYIVEPKFDGWRCLVFRLPERVYLQSRTGRDLARYFPEIVAAADPLPVGVVLDSELVIWYLDRTDFGLLQRRVAGADRRHPATLVCFDLLQHPDHGVLLRQPLLGRRELLEQLLADAPAEFALCPQSASFEQAEEWLAHWTTAGVEGVVMKRASGLYLPGRRGWLKRRARQTVDVVIGGVIGSIDRPRGLLVGQPTASGQLAYRGRTVPLTAAQSRELGHLFAAVGLQSEDSPWPNPLPGRWANLSTDQPVTYVAVEPILIAEVDADTAFEHGRFRHPLRYLRLRLDLLRP